MKKTSVYFLFLFLSIILNNCQSLSTIQNTNSFYSSHLQSISTYKLSNKIPVIIKQENEAKRNTIQICFNTSVTNISTEKAGIQKTLFNLLIRESKNFSSDNLSKLLFLKQAKIESSTTRDGCIISLTCFDNDTETLLTVLLDCLLNPTFDSFDDYMKTIKTNLEYSISGIHYLFNIMSETLSEQSNYFNKTSITKNSFDNITLDSLKEFYQTIFSTNNISVVCCGNFDNKTLLKKLNIELGHKKLSNTTVSKPIQISLKNTSVTKKSIDKSKADFSIGIKLFPQPTSEEFIPTYLASLIYTDTLTNVVREKKGACYTIYNSINFSKQPIVCLIGHSITNKINFYSGIEETKNILFDNKVIQEKNGEDFQYTTLDNQIMGYKNSLINILYNNNYTSEQKANKLSSGILIANDYNYFYSLENKILTTSIEDVKASLYKLLNSEEQCFYLSCE